MEPYEKDGRDNTSAKVRRQEEILARVAIVEGDDIGDLIDDVFMGCDEEEDALEAGGLDVDGVYLYRSGSEIGMECDVTEEPGRPRRQPRGGEAAPNRG